ncbi:MAG: lipocalin family protein [Sphingobacteriales bacterium]|nr:lipocalin family protein [Sphingobacteriales bacterium]
MKNLKLSVVLLLAITLVSCIHSANKALLVGEWKGAEWLANGKPSDNDASKVYLKFSDDGGYVSDFGGSREKGTYILRENKLFTTAEDQLEIMVEIAKLTKDSLVFNMNRGGQPEILILIRK